MAESIAHTNLGIDNRLKIALPVLQAPPIFFFGKPRSYTGEYYTVQLVGLLSQHCSSFVDVGANWGFFSYYVSQHNPSIPVYWFEPNAVLYQSIITNTASNRLKSMHGSRQALSDTNGNLSFYVEKGSGFTSSLIKPDIGSALTEMTVESIRFEDWVLKNGIDGKLLVKVDVENAEWQFIKGAAKTMDKIDFLVMEVLGPARQNGFINYMINDLALQSYYINENKIEHVLQEDMRYTKGEYNWVFCRLLPAELKKKLAGTLFTVIA
jgi:FkbM family methyltransferase